MKKAAIDAVLRNYSALISTEISNESMMIMAEELMGCLHSLTISLPFWFEAVWCLVQPRKHPKIYSTRTTVSEVFSAATLPELFLRRQRKDMQFL